MKQRVVVAIWKCKKHLFPRHAPVAMMCLLLLENPHPPHNQYFRSTRWKLKNYGQHRFIKTCGIIKCGLSRSPPIPSASLQSPATDKVEISIPFESLKVLYYYKKVLEDTVRLFGTFLLFDPIHFPKSEPCLIIGSVCQIGALLGTSL